MAEAKSVHAQRWEGKAKDLVPRRLLQGHHWRRLNRWWNKIAGAEIAIRRMEATKNGRSEFGSSRARVRGRAGRQDFAKKCDRRERLMPSVERDGAPVTPHCAG